MTKKFMGATLLIGASLFAGAATAATPSPTYVAKAGAGDLYETQSSKLVLASTADPKVRSFAARMIADHAKSSAMIKTAATKSGIKVHSPKLDAGQTAMIVALTTARGAKRDALYLTQQHKAHEQALALHENYASNGDKPALKAAAAKIVPVVKLHIEQMPM